MTDSAKTGRIKLDTNVMTRLTLASAKAVLAIKVRVYIRRIAS